MPWPLSLMVILVLAAALPSGTPGTARAQEEPIYTPVLLEAAFEDTLSDGSLPLRNGDTFHVNVRLGLAPDTTKPWTPEEQALLADSLEITLDSSELDTGSAGPTHIERRGGGWYRITHAVSADNPRPDTTGIALKIEVAARPKIGAATLQGPRLRVCLSNHPPVHLTSRILNPKVDIDGLPVASRMGDSLRIESRWSSPDGLPLQAYLDLSNIVSDENLWHLPMQAATPNVFSARVRLPLNEDVYHPDGPGKKLLIHCYEGIVENGILHLAGCGRTTDQSLSVDIDVTRPDTALVALRLDELPQVTTEKQLVVSGHVNPQESFIVLILRNRTLEGVARPDSATGAFRDTLELRPGRNEIQARVEDRSKNTTPLSPAIVVTLVEGAELDITAPYSRRLSTSGSRSLIVLRHPDGMIDPALRIFNLEGDCVYQESAPAGRRMEATFQWEGVTSDDGRRLPQGYYIVRGEWTEASGGRKSLTRGLVLKD